MDTNDLIKQLLQSEQRFADYLVSCMDGSQYDPRHVALAISKIEQIFHEVLELQEEIFEALDQ